MEKNAKPNDKANILASGHIVIKDVTDKKNPVVLVNKRNAIHFGNFAKHLAFSLANKSNHGIFFMNFGNGGSYINSNGEVVYKTTNTSDAPSSSSKLYNPTYGKVVDNTSSLATSQSSDYVLKNNIVGVESTTSYSDIVIRCTLDLGEPTNQSVFDSGAADNDSYTFDELGLISLDPTVGAAQYEDASQNIPKGILLTHVIFHPIQKTLNRVIEVVYTLRIQMQ